MSQTARPRALALPRSARLRLAARLAVVLLTCNGLPARADTEARLPDDATAAPAHERAFKLSLGRYGGLDGGPGADVNLRYQGPPGTAWVGFYRDPGAGQQVRAGWESAFTPVTGLALSVQPSLQIASGGFAGGSVTAEYGEPWFVLAGFGRTNLKPYFNLNFDPNDAWTVALGHRNEQGRTLYAMLIADNRTGTGQRHLHLTARLPMADRQRLSIDLLHKTGLGDSGPVRAWGTSLTWDWPGWFVRLAYDPKQNFSAFDVVRLSTGTRF